MRVMVLLLMLLVSTPIHVLSGGGPCLSLRLSLCLCLSVGLCLCVGLCLGLSMGLRLKMGVHLCWVDGRRLMRKPVKRRVVHGDVLRSGYNVEVYVCIVILAFSIDLIAAELCANCSRRR